MDVERIFRLLGNPGRFQVLVYVLLCCNYFPVAVNHLVMAIYGAKTPHHCRQTLTSESNNVSAEFELNHFDSSADSCYEKEGSGNTTESCHNGWQYLNQYREYNIIMQWDLVCDKAYMVSMATSVYFGGVMLGGIVFGTLADRFGRKPLMLTALYGHIFVGTALAFANSYPMFVALRFLLGVLLQGLQTCTFVLLMELFSVKHRTVVGTAFELFWAVGVIWLAVVAMLVREWRFIQLALTLPSVLTIVYIWAIPESFRWLIAHGRLAEAEQVIKKAAKFNQVHIPEDALKPLKKQESNPLVTSGEENGMVIDCERTNVKDRKYTICDMFRTTQLCKRSLIMFYIWFVVAVSYYGLTLNITSLSGDKYINLLLGGLLELPAYAIAMFIINRFGRRLPLFVYLSVGGILCILAGCLPSSSPVVSSRTLQLMSTGFAVFGRCSIASCWSVILLYTSELYPTVIRNIGMGTCAFWNRIGGMIAPQILLLGNYTTEWLPVLIFGCLALVAAGLTFLLPETHGLPLPDTLHDTEATETSAQPKSAMISEEAGGMDELGSLHTDKV